MPRFTPPVLRFLRRAPAATLLLGLAACGPTDDTSAATRLEIERGRELARAAQDSADSVARFLESLAPRPGDVVDSALPVDEQVRRFREGMGAPRTALTGGAPSRDSLVRAFLERLQERDSIGLATLAMTAPEFIDLYYPASRFAAPPYLMAPQLLWMQIQLNSEKGFTRLMQRVAGTPVTLEAIDCDPPVALGAGRTWERCRLTVRRNGAAPEQVTWFGAILERDGHFKFVGFSNSM